MISESQIAANMASAYQHRAAKEYLLAHEMLLTGLKQEACALQRKASYYTLRSRHYREWMEQ